MCSHYVPGMPTRFPAWTENLGAMIDRDASIRVSCSRCGEWRNVDVAALAERVGRDYSLIDRRCLCRLTAGCKGWNRFHFLAAVYRPLWTEERSMQWLAER